MEIARGDAQGLLAFVALYTFKLEVLRVALAGGLLGLFKTYFFA